MCLKKPMGLLAQIKCYSIYLLLFYYFICLSANHIHICKNTVITIYLLLHSRFFTQPRSFPDRHSCRLTYARSHDQALPPCFPGGHQLPAWTKKWRPFPATHSHPSGLHRSVPPVGHQLRPLKPSSLGLFWSCVPSFQAVARVTYPLSIISLSL